MREIFVVTKDGKAAVAFESEEDAALVAKKLYPYGGGGGFVEAVPYVASDSETDSAAREIDSEPRF